MYRKYYKLIEGYQLDPENFEKYRSYFTPILKDLENFYCSAIEKWRLNNDIESIDYLVGHSFGGYWCGSYALKYPENVNNLVLLSPVGIERHVQAVTNTDPISDRIEVPTLDPTSYKFLSRLPILSKNTFSVGIINSHIYPDCYHFSDLGELNCTLKCGWESCTK